ncbi:PREDICTED: protein FRIGIDA isoform X2 [Ipomoea nil]|uniref:protein FRIGIDA isoform X2 n=1 Tax=Ipomoea nil TaxID=35883 RepID=UPI0009010265|nr:PREDICTED: protein FRIGIDA isoform X2 [Ipomoea nil]
MAQPATAAAGVTSPQPKMESEAEKSQLPPLTAEFEGSVSNPQSQSEQPPSCPADTFAGLRGLSTALSAFQRCYDELQGHMNYIKTAIDSIVQQGPAIATPKQDELPIAPANQASYSAPIEENQPKHTGSELEHLCRTMNSRGLRKYMVSQLSEISKLREEVPKALKLAPNPGRLALDCSGRFFLQGSKAFADKKSPMIPAREASVLILECFLLMEIDQGIGIENAVKEEAEQAAVAWRKRLITEGGLGKASKMDSRGLLLLIGCFGIPALFRYEDFRDLLRTSNAKEIKTALRKSSLLMTKIPEVIDWMVKSKMEVDAVDIAYTCGIEDQINPQKLLISFLRESKESSNKRKKAALGSPAAVNESNKKRLSGLKSVVKCLESHNVDPAKLLPGWQISEMITSLEKEIAELNKKTAETAIQKRKVNETESFKKFKNHEVKRSRLDGVPNHLHSYYAPPSLYAPGPGSLAESMVGSVAGTAGAVLTGGPGAGVSAGAHTVLHTGPYAGVHGGMVLDHADIISHNRPDPADILGHNSHIYRLHGDTAMYDRIGSQIHAYVPSSSLESSIAFRTAAAAAAAVGGPGRTAASDPYQQHPDGVETEVYQRAAGGVPAHHTSYML